MKQHKFYEHILLKNIYIPYSELCSLHENLLHSEKERKELLAFYKKF